MCVYTSDGRKYFSLQSSQKLLCGKYDFRALISTVSTIMSQSSLYDLSEVDEVGAQREKITIVLSSDTEETKPPTKMAKEEPTLMDLKRLLDDVKREQGAFKKMFSTRIEALKTEQVTTIDSKVSSLKRELNDRLGKLYKKTC